MKIEFIYSKNWPSLVPSIENSSKPQGFPKVTFNHAALKGISRTACTDVESVPRYIYVEVNLQNCF